MWDKFLVDFMDFEGISFWTFISSGLGVLVHFENETKHVCFFSFFVIAAHTAYVIALYTNFFEPIFLVYIALLAYFLYIINALQFIWKFRLARLSLDKGQVTA